MENEIAFANTLEGRVMAEHPTPLTGNGRPDETACPLLGDVVP